MSEDLYETLGVGEDATDKEIKDAYRDKAKQTHPDKEGGDKEKFQLVQKAYSILSDPHKRKLYDETGEDGDVVDVFEQKLSHFFGTYLFASITKLEKMEDVTHMDLKKVFLRIVDLCIQEAKSNLNRIKKEQKKQELMEEFLKRFNSPSKVELKKMFEAEIKSRGKKINHEVKHWEDEIEFLEKVKVIISDVSYDFTEIKQQTTTFTSGTNWFEIKMD